MIPSIEVRALVKEASKARSSSTSHLSVTHLIPDLAPWCDLGSAFIEVQLLRETIIEQLDLICVGLG